MYLFMCAHVCAVCACFCLFHVAHHLQHSSLPVHLSACHTVAASEQLDTAPINNAHWHLTSPPPPPHLFDMCLMLGCQSINDRPVQQGENKHSSMSYTHRWAVCGTHLACTIISSFLSLSSLLLSSCTCRSMFYFGPT